MSQTKSQLIEGSTASELTAAKTLLGAGSAGAPSLTATGDTNTGIFFPTADTLAASTAGSERLRITSAGLVGIGTTSPGSAFEVKPSASSATLGIQAGTINTDSIRIQSGGTANTYLEYRGYLGHAWFVDATEYARIDSSGRLLIGTSSARTIFDSTASLIQVETTSNANRGISLTHNINSAAGTYLQFAKTRGSGNAIVSANDVLGTIIFGGADGTNVIKGAQVLAEVDGTPGANDMPGRLVFSTTADGASSPTERMRITASGDVTTSGTSTFSRVNAGFTARSGDSVTITRSAGTPLEINRQGSDGTLVIFYESNVSEGNISVSGSTVSYNGAHLSRWSQLPGGQEREEILRGSVLSNIDEMCEWGDEENEQLNRMKVSDVEGDKNVSGVFQAWDDDDDTYTNDFYCAMTGDFIIRIGAGTTVERGDLLMSAGDGTAKPVVPFTSAFLNGNF
jgi:hypothetical protein